GDIEICPPEQIKCVETALGEFLKSPAGICSCETPCKVTRYGKELSMVKIPSKGSAHFLSRKYKKSEEYIRDNFLVLDIYFEALNYGTIEQRKAYDVAGLLGDIGGQMGLFIGASILTVLEIFDYIYEVIKRRLQRLLRPQKDEKTTNPTGTVATVSLEDMETKESGEKTRSQMEGAYSNTILPNHHHHVHHNVFEDFAC
ncbi:hypothetical protein AAFF_G00308830, partial [Aldrovandia affinis]